MNYPGGLADNKTTLVTSNATGLGRPRKIALFGAFGVGNLGNECTLQSLLYHVRKRLPDVQVNCICTGPEETRSAYNISASAINEMPFSPIQNRALRFLRRMVLGIPVEVCRWFKAMAKLRDVDMLVMTGTGMLGDFGISPFGLHYEILKWTIAANLCGCKVVFLSVGAGPLRHPLSRTFVKVALSCANYRSYRDQFSRDYLKSIGFYSERDDVYPDLAYSFPKTILPAPEPDHSKRVVGVGLMTYFNRRCNASGDDTVYQDYIARLGNFVIWLTERKYEVRLLIGDVVYDEQARNDLRQFITEQGIDYESGKIVDEPAASVDDVLSQIQSVDIVVASRFHNVLLALMSAKPVLALSYHEKVQALMADSGLAEFCQDIESIDLQRMTGQFTSLEDRSNEIKRQLRQKAKGYRSELDEQYDHILGTSFHSECHDSLTRVGTNG